MIHRNGQASCIRYLNLSDSDVTWTGCRRVIVFVGLAPQTYRVVIVGKFETFWTNF